MRADRSATVVGAVVVVVSGAGVPAQAASSRSASVWAVMKAGYHQAGLALLLLVHEVRLVPL